MEISKDMTSKELAGILINDLLNSMFHSKVSKTQSEVGKILASKFPELKRLSFSEFLQVLPFELDYFVAREMHYFLNQKELTFELEGTDNKFENFGDIHENPELLRYKK